jgi:hypothetical protein
LFDVFFPPRQQFGQLCGMLRSQIAGFAWVIGQIAVKIVKVQLDSNGKDILGERLCFALKEKIRASRGFELVDAKEAQQSPTGFTVHIISLDTSEGKGYRSWAAIAFTLPLQNTTELYQDLEVVDFGSTHVDDTADDVMADIDQESAALQK